MGGYVKEPGLLMAQVGSSARVVRFGMYHPRDVSRSSPKIESQKLLGALYQMA